MSDTPKVQDPGAEPSKIGVNKLPGIVAYLRRNPDATLRSGEGKLLLDEIDRLCLARVEAREVIASAACSHEWLVINAKPSGRERGSGTDHCAKCNTDRYMSVLDNVVRGVSYTSHNRHGSMD